jgi:mannose-6-phosphate isomerase-like protein (cupin superfamily)
VSLDSAKHVFRPGDGETLEWSGSVAGKVSIMVDPLNTGETGLCVLIQTLDSGAAVPVHHHEKAEQVLFVLSGCGKVSLADQEFDAAPGTMVHVPKGVAHSISNTGGEPMSILETTSPPGFQALFRKLAKLSKPEPEDIVRIGAQHDIVVHPVEDA